MSFSCIPCRPQEVGLTQICLAGRREDLTEEELDEDDNPLADAARIAAEAATAAIPTVSKEVGFWRSLAGL